MNLSQYIETVNKRYKSGISREHAYRRDLEELIRELVAGVEITNEPSNVTDCGNPDYVITKGKIPVGYIEAKDVGKDLNHKNYKEQFARYRKALDNLIITDYTWFQFFQNGELVHEIRIADVGENTVRPLPENFEQFTALIRDFCTFVGQTIKSPKKLAEMMAGKAKLLQNILEQAVTSDEMTQANSSLQDQYNSFKNILIHDLEPKAFADIYAQTLAYGMFAARLHDTCLDDFSRQEAAELIPKTNPFLRKLFGYIAGPDIDDRIRPTVDNLAEVFRATNVEALLKNFGKSTKTSDPIIHFYETFLSEYDPKLRKARGVWYTPEPVVNFIVRAVDELLKTEFGLKDGLADTSKTKIKVVAQGTAVAKGKDKGKAIIEEREVHKVQILDPAAGTGTFLAEVVKFIYNGKFQAMQGAWSGYVEEHLIPRLNGFELLMASYAMAHLKLDMLLAETGYQPKKDQRFNVYLTNSLEEHHPDTGTLFANWLSTEANEANHIKRDTPVMVVLGNPPYSGISKNMGEWICKLIEDYKYVDGEHFGERKHWLHDDYVKFIRYGQHFVDKNGEGILAYINNHSFIDNPTFRGMRWNLLRSFDKIYIIDLHGNSKRKEVCPDGSKDENVFDITAGVSINLFVKTGKKKPDALAEIWHCDLWGKREQKYDFLQEREIGTVDFQLIQQQPENYFFKPMQFESQQQYDLGFYISDLLPAQSMGVTTARDDFVIDIDQGELKDRIILFCDKATSNDVFKQSFPLKENYQWKVDEQRALVPAFNESYIKKISYRPFDIRWIYFQTNLVFRDRKKVMDHLAKENLALTCVKLGRSMDSHNYFITNEITDKSISSSLDNSNVFPLYLYSDGGQLDFGEHQTRKPNLNAEIVAQIAEGLGLEFTNEKENRDGTYAPIDLLDYIYAVLHSPTYREKYKEFLKIDFPRIPYPTDVKKFWQLVQLGGELRQIHLLESPVVEQSITRYPIDGDNTVTRSMTAKSIGYEPVSKESGRVWINDTQYFENVPLIAWESYIGGYQPAQKWLKDRNGSTLNFDDILHYQKIIVALTETDRLMKAIDQIGVE
ncbi:MAG: type ISP restriction/modification enzyme [Kiritimatiellales bacterium]